MQLIYSGKTKKCFPRFKFSEPFSLSANPKHFSNNEESVKSKKSYYHTLKSSAGSYKKPNQAAILTMDTFHGQMTQKVVSLLRTNNVWLVKIPNNMTYLFQPFLI